MTLERELANPTYLAHTPQIVVMLGSSKSLSSSNPNQYRRGWVFAIVLSVQDPYIGGYRLITDCLEDHFGCPQSDGDF